MFITLNREKAKAAGELPRWESWAKATNQPDKFKLYGIQNNPVHWLAFYINYGNKEVVGSFPKSFFDIVEEDYKIEDFL